MFEAIDKIENDRKLKWADRKLTIFAIVAALLVSPFTVDRKDAEKTLKQNDYTQISTSAMPQFLACSNLTFYRTGFEATDRSGRHVKGAVCGWPYAPSIQIDTKPQP